MALAVIFIGSIVFFYYKPTYAVTLNGEFVGYTDNKSNMQKKINKYINAEEQSNVAFIQVDQMPEYKLCLLKKNVNCNDEEIYAKAIEDGTAYYKYYAITDDKEVSITRKLREITKALKLEQEYTKDQILEAYLNVVNFGNNCQGVESAAQLYFGKSIKDCSIAECAAIAGITQNPSRWNPLVFPENNKERREIVLNEMYDQEKISKDEFDAAMKESATMTFVGWQASDDDDDDDEADVQNWYIDQLFRDLQKDIAEYYNISETAASSKLYTEGLKIYCAMDENAQTYLENAALNIDKSNDSDLQIASTIMGYDGSVSS